jgi:hypothetical protein
MTFRLRSIQTSLLILLSIFTLSFLITSCGTEAPIKEEVIENGIEAIVIDDANTEDTAADTSATGVHQEVVEEEVTLQEAMRTNAAPEIEESKLSFCDCVKKNKALTDKMMSDDATDEEFDAAMEELGAMKTGDCKIMFPAQNNIEEKQAHALKVKRCLK